MAKAPRTNQLRIPGALAPGSRPAGSSKFPQGGKLDSLSRGVPQIVRDNLAGKPKNLP